MRTTSIALAAGIVLSVSLASADVGKTAAAPSQVTPSQSTPPVAPRPIITVSQRIGAVGATVQLRAFVSFKGDPFIDHRVDFTVDGASAGWARTDADGYATRDYTIPSTLGLGWKQVEVSYGGEPGFPASKATGKLSVLKSASYLTVRGPVAGAHVGDQVEVLGELTRITDGGGLAGRELEFYLDDKLVEKKLTYNGMYYSFSFKAAAAKKYKANVRFAGDPLYLPTAGTVTIDSSVQQPPAPVWVTLDGPPIPMPIFDPVGGSHAFSGTVSLAPPGLPVKPLANVEVVIQTKKSDGTVVDMEPVVNGTFATIKTNASGRFAMVWKPEQRYYGALVMHLVVSDDKYNTIVPGLLPSVFVQPAKLTIALAGPNTGKVGQKQSYTATVRRSSDNGPAKNVSLRIGPGASATTDANGVAKFDYAPSPGDYPSGKIKVQYAEEDNGGDAALYLDAQATKTIQVSPATN